MRIPAPCARCFLDSHKEGKIVLFSGHMLDEGYVLVDCNKGHKSVIIYDERKHDLLFQSACLAFIDGYEREAVSGFAASLERLYEFFIRIISRKENVEDKVFEKTWKLISKQSERQFGCFVMLYALETGEPYEIQNKLIEFRNKVIHQGYIPKSQETREFGENVFAIKKEITKLLTDRYSVFVKKEIEHDLNERKKRAPKELPQLNMKATLVHVNTETNVAYDIETFTEYLEAMRNRLKYIR